MAAEQEIMRRVVCTVRESIWLHCYLACGHMITLRREDLEKSLSPSPIECWACEEEAKSGLPSK